MCSAHHDLPVGQGFTAVNKLEMLAWSGEGYKSSLGKKNLTNIRPYHISCLKTNIRGQEFLSRHKQKVLVLEYNTKTYLTVLPIILLPTWMGVLCSALSVPHS